MSGDGMRSLHAAAGAVCSVSWCGSSLRALGSLPNRGACSCSLAGSSELSEK